MPTFSVTINNIYYFNTISFARAFDYSYEMMTEAGFTMTGAVCYPEGITKYFYRKGDDKYVVTIHEHTSEPKW